MTTWEPARTRTMDPCPTCGQDVDMVDGTHVARPCGHHVGVIIWPDRFELVSR